MRRVFVTALLLVAFGDLVHAQDLKPIIDNERVTVWDTINALPPAENDFVAVSFKGTAVFISA
jgi:hypothetical protein